MGAIREGTLRQAFRRGDDVTDHVMWSMLADEWHAADAGRPEGAGLMNLGTATDAAEPARSASAVNAPTKLFVCAVIAAGTLALLHAAAAILTTPVNGYAIVLGLLTIAGGRFSIKIPGRSATVSFSEVFVFTSVILFGPGPATVTVAIDGLWMSLRQRDRRVHRALFNVAEPAVSTWMAGYVFFFVVAETTIGAGHTRSHGTRRGNRRDGGDLLPPQQHAHRVCRRASKAAVRSRQLWRQHAAFLAINDYAAASLAALLVRNGSGVDLQAVGLVAPLLLLSYAAYKASASRLDAAQASPPRRGAVCTRRRSRRWPLRSTRKIR